MVRAFLNQKSQSYDKDIDHLPLKEYRNNLLLDLRTKIKGLDTIVDGITVTNK